MFIDEVEVVFQAGDGGAGRASFFPGFKTGPDGGNGGQGGNIYLAASSDLSLLQQFQGRKNRIAESGEKGGKNNKYGRNGKDLTILLPLGSAVTNLETKETIEMDDLNKRVLICKGGFGGRGTKALASSRNTTPTVAEPGRPGEIKKLKIVLKLIADFGLIGLPNAGKSSILNELTKANVKVADYPFTTLEPNLGTMGKIIIADIPGLIEGASAGRGLGIKFLKHIEKVSMLLHCISCESENLDADYRTVRKELMQYNPLLSEKPEIILLTKADMVSDKDLEKKRKILKKRGKVYLVSILDDRYHPSNLPVFQSDFNPARVK